MKYKEHMRAAGLAYLRAMLAEYGTVAKAAKASGLQRTHFYKLMQRFGIKPLNAGHRGNEAWRALAS